jgi:hypothetical protein
MTMHIILKHTAGLCFALSTISSALASPTLSTSAEYTILGISQSVTNSDTPVSRAEIDSQLITGFRDPAAQASAVSRANYITQARAEVFAVASADARAGWSETFTNSSSDNLAYSFTYRIGAGSLYSSLDLGVIGTGVGGRNVPEGVSQSAGAQFTSTLGVTLGAGPRNDFIVSRSAKAAGVTSLLTPGPAPVTYAGTGPALAGEAINALGESWGDTYITIEIGAVAAGESFTLDYLFLAAAFNNTPFTQNVRSIVDISSSSESDPRVGLFSRPIGTTVPEPANILLLALGLAGLSAARRRARLFHVIF